MPAQMAEDIRRAVDASAGALRRNITEAEAAEAILFLASAASSGITGQIIAVDGGRIFH
jgi:enoyl-[acyl-carrier-protein] reductase (NADH)